MFKKIEVLQVALEDQRRPLPSGKGSGALGSRAARLDDSRREGK